MSPDYPLALATGLLGGFGHCIGMCGPIVGTVALRAGAGAGPRLLPHLVYHAGRLLTYAFLGALTGLGGSFVNTAGRLAGFQDAVALAAGTGLVVLGLGIMGILPLPGPGPGGAWHRFAGHVLGGGSPAALFPLGLLLGFLPCGLSATALLMSAATADPLQGYLLALLFGLGTVPALLLFGLVVGRLGAGLRGALYRASGAVVLGMGLLTLRRGLAAHALL